MSGWPVLSGRWWRSGATRFGSPRAPRGARGYPARRRPAWRGRWRAGAGPGGGPRGRGGRRGAAGGVGGVLGRGGGGGGVVGVVALDAVGGERAVGGAAG